MLTGKLPDPDLTASVVDHPQNLFTLLDGRYGYNVVGSVTEMSWSLASIGAPR